MLEIADQQRKGVIANCEKLKQNNRYKDVLKTVSDQLNREYNDALAKYNRLFELRTIKMQELNEQLSNGIDLKKSAISETYQRRMNELDLRMQKQDPTYVDYLRSKGFKVKDGLEDSGNIADAPIENPSNI